MKKIICFGVLLIMLFSLSACGNKYGAVMYSHTKLWMNEEFLATNKTYGIYYEEGDFTDRTSPESRTFIIKEQDEFEKIFTEFPPGINFEKEILLIYIFTDIYPNNSYDINKIDINNKILEIKFKIKRSFGMGAAQPAQRCLIVKIEKLDIEMVEFMEV